MENKHTPGPWQISKFVADNDIVESVGPAYWIQPKSRMTLTCMACVGGFTKEEAKANARLIAAAPDLLEALNHLCKTVRPYIMQLKVKKGFSELVALAGAEKAIRKATKQED